MIVDVETAAALMERIVRADDENLARHAGARQSEAYRSAAARDRRVLDELRARIIGG